MPYTLREQVEMGVRVRLYCLDCCRDRTVPLAPLVSARDLEMNTPTRQLAARMRCSRCNGTSIDLMTPSHRIGPPKDERERRLETNVKRVPCPECGSPAVSRSGPLLRRSSERPRYLSGMIYQYECEDCGNWWSAE